MNSIITDEQKAIIAELAGEMHSNEFNALVNFGGKMYRDGIIKGAAVAMIGVGVGVVVHYIIKRNLKEIDDLR